MTKCNNCRFRAEISNSGPVSGRIVVDKGVYLEDEKGDFVGVLSPDGEEIMSMSGRSITDLEIVPRDPETYRDWQVGDRVHYPNGDNDIVIFRSGELVVLADDFTEENSDVTAVNTCSQLFDRREGRLVLTDIEQQIIEERKKAEWKPQDGDVCFVRTDAGNCFIFIKREHKSDEEIHSYACFDTNLWSLCLAKVSCVCDRQSIRELRPATDKEKQILFDAMAKKGMRWNAEKKVVEKISNSPEFKAKEVVMVRDAKERWKLMAFVAIGNGAYKYEVTNGEKFSAYKQCIPYNEKTMHLLGTGEDYKEE